MRKVVSARQRVPGVQNIVHVEHGLVLLVVSGIAVGHAGLVGPRYRRTGNEVSARGCFSLEEFDCHRVDVGSIASYLHPGARSRASRICW